LVGRNSLRRRRGRFTDRNTVIGRGDLSLGGASQEFARITQFKGVITFRGVPAGGFGSRGRNIRLLIAGGCFAFLIGRILGFCFQRCPAIRAYIGGTVDNLISAY
jgi:hypothetical protein